MLKRLLRVFSILALLAPGCSTVTFAQSVTFVQLTDLHLYDAGNHLLPAGAREEFLDNRDALDWAVLQINRMQSSGKHLDFVVITGDFGLDAPPTKLGSTAIDQLAVSLDALLVDPILVVPGNNDLADEKPADIKRFRQFLADLKAKLPDHTIVDLTQQTVVINHVRLLGLDSASFKNSNGKDRETNRAVQLKELQRLAAEIQKDQPHIVFTHIPNVEDPFRGPFGKDIHNAWQVDRSVSDIWNKLASSKEVVATFAGHFHDPRRTVYGQDFGWAQNKPEQQVGLKTWIAPPLAAKFQQQVNPQARGFLTATVLSTGKVNAAITWWGSPTQAPVPADKSEYLVEGVEAVKDEDWEKSAQAYRQALASSDSSTRELAKNGYENARDHLRSDFWAQSPLPTVAHFLRHTWLALLLVVLLVGLVGGSVWRKIQQPYNPVKPPMLLPPIKYTTDAPAELFAAEMIAAAEELRETFRDISDHPYIGSAILQTPLLHPSHSFQVVIDSIPDVREVKLGKIAAFFVALFQYFSWHVESGIAVYMDRAVGIAFLRRAWRTRMVLRATAAIAGPTDIVRISRDLAYNIVGIAFVDRR
jgi:3',5'-cyclic AMP phosphodiesterase CpdA